jgi:hypothetical protein
MFFGTKNVWRQRQWDYIEQLDRRECCLMATTKEWAMRQLLVHSRLGKHFAQILGHIPFIAERAVGPAEHIAGELEGHCLIHAE